MNELIIIALSIAGAAITALSNWHYRREIARRDREILRLRRLVKEQDTELERRADAFANLSVDYADAVYAAKDARLAAAVRRYGRGNVEYAYLGVDEAAADAGHDYIFRN